MDETGKAKAHADSIPLAVYAALGLLVIVLAINQFQISTLESRLSVPLQSSPVQTSASAVSSSVGSASLQAIVDKVIPKGVPAVYGTELGVSYDKPVESLTVLGKLDGDLYPDGKLKFSDLSVDAQKRYVAMGTMIACEYCCGANALVSPNGQPACGCQHSAAMRGLAKYLLKNHPEVSDAQILEEMGKWKTLFFPKQIISKAVSFASAGKDINTIDLTSNKFLGFKPPASVQNAPAGGETQAEMNARMHPDQVQAVANAPDMVGGC